MGGARRSDAALTGRNINKQCVTKHIQYGTYFSTNHMAWAASAAGVSSMFIVWLFPLVLILPATAAISRWIYKVTRNPYLPAIINALIVVLFACTNTRTMF